MTESAQGGRFERRWRQLRVIFVSILLVTSMVAMSGAGAVVGASPADASISTADGDDGGEGEQFGSDEEEERDEEERDTDEDRDEAESDEKEDRDEEERDTDEDWDEAESDEEEERDEEERDTDEDRDEGESDEEEERDEEERDTDEDRDEAESDEKEESDTEGDIGQTDGPTEIDACTVIDTPGHYVLTGDLTGSQTCLEITADDVSLDGMGYTVSSEGESEDTRFGVSVNGADNVVVENLTLAGWDTGLDYRDASDGQVSDIVIENGGTGAAFDNAHDNDISGLTIQHNENRALTVGTGISSSATGNTFTDITAIDNERSGSGSFPGAVHIGTGASNNEFDGLTASESVAGVWTAGGSAGNTFTDVVANDNDRYGLTLESNNGDTFDDVHVAENGWHGIRLGETNGNELTNVVATENDGTAIYLVGDLSGGTATTNNVFESVTATDNDGSGFGFSNADNNELRDLEFENNTGSAVDVTSRSSGNTVTDAVATEMSGNIFSVGPDNEDNTFEDIEITDSQGGMSLLGESSTVSGLTVSDGAGTALTVSTGMVSGAQAGGSENTLTDITVENFEGTGIRIGGEATDNELSAITITDLEGTALSLDSGSHNTIAEATVTAVDVGVSFGDADENRLESVTLDGTTVSGYGSDVRLNATDEPAQLPEGVDPTGHYVEVTGTSESATLEYLEFSYDSTALGDIEETSLRVWRHDGEWRSPADDSFISGYDTDETYAFAYGVTDLTDTSTLGLFGETDPEPVGMGGLQGTVSEDENGVDGDALDGVQLVVANDDGFGALTETASDGSYTLSLPVGTYELEASLEGYLDKTVTDVAVTADATADLDIALQGEPEPGTLSGTVTEDESGEPVPRPTVVATDTASGEEWSITGEFNGAYELELPPGTYTIEVSAFGFESAVFDDVTITEDGATTADIPLEQAQYAVFTATPAEPVVEETVTFNASESTLPDGDIEGYSWDFTGDGNVDTTTTEPVVTHEYSVAGEYEVTLEVQSDLGYPESTTEMITVREQPESDIVVYGASADSTTVEDGETVTVTGNLFNDGELDGEKEVTLTADGEEVTAETVSVDGGEITTVELTWTASLPAGEETATVDLRLNGLVADSVTVENRYSDIQVIAASPSETELVAGEEFYTVGSLYQNGTIDGPEDIALNATKTGTDETIELATDEDRTLSPGFYHLGAVNLTGTLEEPGTYDLELGDRSAGTIEVLPAESDLQVIAASPSETELVAGEEFYTVGSLYQGGTIEGPEDIALNATNTDTDKTITLATDEDRTLSPGFYHLGAVNLTATIPEPGTYDLELGDRPAGTIEVEPAVSDIQVIAASSSEDEIVAGEDEFYTVGSLYQGGTIDGPEDIALNATNTDTDKTITLATDEDRTLSPGFYHLGAVNLTATIEEPGTYDLELGDRAAGSIEVLPAESDIQVIAASSSEDEIVAGEEFYTVGSLYQGGTIDGPEDIALTATKTGTDETIELATDEDRTLSPGFYHLGAVNLTATIEEPGTYDLELGDRPAGTIEVEPAVSDIQVIAASSSEDEIVAGEDEFYTVGSLYQGGTIDGPEDIELTATNTDNGETTTLATDEDRTLSPGFYHLGAGNLTATIEEPGTYDLELGDRPAGTIEVEPAVSDMEVIAASLSEMNVTAGEEFYTVGSIYQNGTIDGPEDITLTATPHDGGDEFELGVAEDVHLSPGFYHFGAINITSTIEDSGRYDLTLGDRDVGTIGVDESPSDIQVIAASLSEIEVLENEELSVVGSIYQNGTANGDTFAEDIELTATDQDGTEQVVGVQEDVELQPGMYHLGAVNITFDIDEPGLYDLALGDQNAGQLEVLPAESDIQVIAASRSEDEIVAGEDEFYTVGSLYQNGTIEGPEDIALNATNTDNGETTTLATDEDRTLSPGMYHLGAVNLTGTIDQPGTYDLELGDQSAGTIEVLPAESDIQVIAASPSETELVAGEEFYTVGSLYQGGTIDGPEDIALTATNDETGDTIELATAEDRTLSPGMYHLGAVTLTATIAEPGTYDLELGDRPAGTIEVLPAESDIQVIAASSSEDEIVAGEEFYTVGSLYQGGTIDGPEDISLNATNTENGETIELATAEDRTLSPGFYHLGAVNLTGTIDQPGTYDLELGDRPAGTIEVLAAESDIQVIAASPSATEVAEGEAFYTVGSLYQGGTIEGPEDIVLTATNDETGDTIELATDTDRTLSPGFYHLGAVNLTAAFESGDAGTYSLELGDRNAGSITVTEPTLETTVTDVSGHSSAPDPATGEPLVYASSEATVDLEVESDLELTDVTLLVSSQQTSFVVDADATHQSGDRWHVSVPIDDIPDDGHYTLSAIAVDEWENAALTQADETLVIDREGPSMAVNFEDVDSSGATVVIESTESLADMPDVSADLTETDGSTTSVAVDMLEENSNSTRFTGEIDFTESGNYSVSVTGTDRAGNDATDTASVAANTDFTLENGEIVIDETGTSIAFELADDANMATQTQELFVALSENANNANLEGGDLGVGFITADLDDLIDYHMAEGTIEHATISMAIDETELHDGVDATDVELQYHDEVAGEWAPVESTVTTVADEPFVTADVTHFSTYGAVVPDDEPPEITSVSPADGAQLELSTNETTLEFAYEDELSGIDVSTISLEVDGTPVTDAQSTSTETTYELEVETGESYTATLSVSDMAGNEATAETQFSVASAGGSSGSGSGDGGGGGSGGAAAPGSGTDDGADDDTESTDETDDAETDSTDDDEPAPEESDETPSVEAEDDTTPGFGAGLAVLVVSLCALLLARLVTTA